MGIQIDKIKGPLMHKHKGNEVNIIYTNHKAMPEKVGGHEVGSTFDKVPLDTMLTNLLYPYQYPALSVFGMVGQAQLFEVGVNIDGDKSFTWNRSNTENILPNTGIIKEMNGNTVISSGIDLLLPPKIVSMTIPNTVPIAKSYRIEGTNGKNQNFVSNLFAILSTYPVYYWKVNSPGATPTRPTAAQGLLAAATKMGIQSNGDITITFNSANDDYIGFAVPAINALFTKWYITALNTGNIGGVVSPGGNLFPDPDTINLTSLQSLWTAIPYRVYNSNYRTSVVSITFKRA